MAPRTIHLAHSPDADDAFMFWAMAEGRIDTGERRYVQELADIGLVSPRVGQRERQAFARALDSAGYDIAIPGTQQLKSRR